MQPCSSASKCARVALGEDLPARACGRRSRRLGCRPTSHSYRPCSATRASGGAATSGAVRRRLPPAAAARRRWRGGRASAGVDHDRSSIRLAISTATRAASRPFSSARAQAWASFSTVRIALAIGSWWSSDDAGDAGAAFVGDQFEVVGLAADDAAERDQRVEVVAVGQRLQRDAAISSAPGTLTCLMCLAATPSACSSAQAGARRAGRSVRR